MNLRSLRGIADATAKEWAWMVGLKRLLRNTWLHPRHISSLYMRQALKQASSHASGTLLDIGCGLRPYHDLLQDQIIQYIGLDWPVAPDKAQVDIVCDALHLPIGSRTIDSVLATELIEHVPDLDQLLTEVNRVLRRRGILIMSAPFLAPLHEEPRDYYRFTPHGLRALLERHGFSIKHIWARGGWWSVVFGSFVSQSLYNIANLPDRQGNERRSTILVLLVLPFCSLAQIFGYWMDRIIKIPSYSLGYVAVGVKEE